MDEETRERIEELERNVLDMTDWHGRFCKLVNEKKAHYWTGRNTVCEEWGNQVVTVTPFVLIRPPYFSDLMQSGDVTKICDECRELHNEEPWKVTDLLGRLQEHLGLPEETKYIIEELLKRESCDLRPGGTHTKPDDGLLKGFLYPPETYDCPF